jgi:hypothetical protein
LKSKSKSTDILIEAFLNNLSVKGVKVHDDLSFEHLRNQTVLKYQDKNVNECYEGLSKYTMDMFDNPVYKEMLKSGFNDVGDLGNYEDCAIIDGATYNIIQLNITDLPIDIRFGI